MNLGFTRPGQFFGQITVGGNANVTLNGSADLQGGGSVNVGGTARLFMNGQVFGDINVTDSAFMAVDYGGLFGGPTANLSVSPTGTLLIYGTDFNFPDGELPVDTGTLTGFYNGQEFSDTFTGGERIFLNQVTNQVTPEPASATLLLLGGLGLLGYKWRNRATCQRPKED